TWKLGPDNLKILSGMMCNGIYIGLLLLYIYQTSQVWRINKHVFTEEVAEIHRYKFKQVAILDLAYFVTFGSELAVVSMLPLFFKETFDLSIVQAGMLASGFAFMNLFARPGGGLFSDKFGRRNTLTLLIAGLAVGYFVLGQIDSGWSLTIAVIATMACSFFVQAGEGAVFAMVPLVKRRMTGQVAGMAGAYGNVGAVTFLTVFSFVTPQMFFMVIGGAALIALAAVRFLDEPQGQTAEVMEDGSVHMIDVT
ncbi:MAG: MFS transporter, partial [Gammaproteobacteria bacterium]|nr:MFS transporter [Gammaproteobacteria bacterium]